MERRVSFSKVAKTENKKISDLYNIITKPKEKKLRPVTKKQKQREKKRKEIEMKQRVATDKAKKGLK